jgi:hypothetical protein
MSRGDVVVWLPEPFDMGSGTITGVNEIGWLEVCWHNGEVGAYCPNALERAEDWERREVEAAFG